MTTLQQKQVPAILGPSDLWPNQPKRLILFGPPGTGKTRACLDYWILRALEAGVQPNEILSCSFTRAAAGELRDRVSKATNIHVDNLRKTCSTIHAECYGLLRQADPEVGIYGKGKVDVEPDDATGGADEVPNDSILQKVGAERYSSMLRFWHYARAMRDRKIFAHLAIEKYGAAEGNALVALVHEYEAAKKSYNQIDFTDMLERALTDEKCAPPARKLLIVDEVQDCSLLQWELIERWAEASEFVIFVGDPDQTIHEWCGARYDKFIDVIESGFDVRRLAQSYRVPMIPHRVAMRLIRRNQDRIEVPYSPAARPGSLEVVDTNEAVSILTQSAKSGEPTFVLCPTNKQCSSWATLLGGQLVPFRSERGNPGPLAGARRKALARALFAIRAGVEPDGKDLERLVDAMPKRGMPLRWKHIDFFPGVSKTEVFKNAVGCVLGFEAAGANFDPLRTHPILSILEMLKTEEADRATFLIAEKWGPEILDRPPSIVITTMHGSKGREAETVLVDLDLPKTIENADPERIQAWRRVVYVAFTRTKNRLVQVGSSLEKFLLK